ncbi:MAG: hypothetical protein JXR76_22330 [Deltaproteobacteria bacterium]|nr:hypothetical protein [Deltaproteobacteria bacterium]
MPLEIYSGCDVNVRMVWFRLNSMILANLDSFFRTDVHNRHMRIQNGLLCEGQRFVLNTIRCDFMSMYQI